MKPINVEQAIFSSADRGAMKGYQLIARSAGIDREASNELCRWSPTRMIDDRPDHWCINAFPISGERVAVTRTVVGGPEYSSRGVSQIVTLILVLRDLQLSRYSYNPILVAKTAMAIGGLRLPLDINDTKLPTIELPGEPLYQAPDPLLLRSTDDEDAGVYEQLNSELSKDRRVAVIGQIDPFKMLGDLIPRLNADQRTTLSFTTGLAPAIRRPFRIHFLREADAPMRHTLNSQSITSIEVGQTVA
ncbi:MAG: hypothetical protein ACPGLY_20945 [Rubripirellula sp.]